MPIFEYRCQACGHDYEELVRRSTPDSAMVCPSCGLADSRRELSVFSTGRSAGRSRSDTRSRGDGCPPSG